MYIPSDDSVLLGNCVKDYHGNLALEIGIGSGIITNILAQSFGTVIGTDIDIRILTFHKNYNDSFLGESFNLICTNAALPFRSNIFDLIVSNPPYLPDDRDNEGKKIFDSAIYGGSTGIEITLHIIRSAIFALSKCGKLLVIISSLSNYQKIYELVSELNLKVRTLTAKKIFFE